MSEATHRTTESNPLYQQHVLHDTTQAIRLLRIDRCIYEDSDAGNEALPIGFQCSFEVHDLETVPDFVPLSYTWGADTLVNDVLCVDGRSWPIRQNLADAMLHIWDQRARWKVTTSQSLLTLVSSQKQRLARLMLPPDKAQRHDVSK